MNFITKAPIIMRISNKWHRLGKKPKTKQITVAKRNLADYNFATLNVTGFSCDI